jgi:hypothetical protein
MRARTSGRVPWVWLALSLSLPVFAQPPQTGAINPGQRIDDKHNPRHGFIVVDEDTRLGYIKNATIWRPFDLTGADLSEGQSLGSNQDGLPKTLPNDKVVVYDFKLKDLGGTTPKFDCDHIKVYNTVEDAANNQHEIPHALKKAKVRYGRSSEQDVKPYSTIIATRIAWALGFFADIETPVREVICNDCTPDPFHQKAPAAGKSFTFTTASLEQHPDPKTCKTAIRNDIGNGRGLDHPIIHQAGLTLLADSLQRLIADDESVLAIFSASKIEQYDDHGTKHTAREWADLFKKRAQSIIDSRCEP